MSSQGVIERGAMRMFRTSDTADGAGRSDDGSSTESCCKNVGWPGWVIFVRITRNEEVNEAVPSFIEAEAKGKNGPRSLAAHS